MDTRKERELVRKVWETERERERKRIKKREKRKKTY